MLNIDEIKNTIITDLQAGKAGEYLVCADLILKGYIAFPSEQGLPFDVVLATSKRLYKIQVKTTRKPQLVPQRVNRSDKYIFHVRRCGNGGRRSYESGDVDIFALVALDSREIAYIAKERARQTMFFLPQNGRVVKPKHGFKTSCTHLSDHRIELCL